MPQPAIKDRHFEFKTQALPHADALYNYALRMCQNSKEAEDLVQETFLRAFRFFDQYESNTNIKAWLFRILQNLYINEFRRKARQPVQVDFEKVENLIDSGSLPGSVHEADTDSLGLGDEMLIALQKLPDDFRRVVMLADLEDFSYEDIAKIMECPIGTVRSRLSRARRQMARSLRRYARELGYDPDLT